MNLLPVRSTDPTDLPWSPNSIYKYSSENRYPEIIIRLDGKLFFDMDAFEKLVRKTRDAQVKKSKIARRGTEDHASY